MDELFMVVFVVILVGGYVFFEDVFGFGKMFVVWSLVFVFGFDFCWLQCMFDMFFGDVMGLYVYVLLMGDFVFWFGLIFIGLFLVDEVNCMMFKI